MKPLKFTYSNGVEYATIKTYSLLEAEKQAKKKLKGSITLTELKY